MNTPAECAALAALLGGGFVRIAQGDVGALFLSDAPRRLPQQAMEAALARLARAGYVARPTAAGLLALDWDEERWRIWRDACEQTPTAAFPRSETLWPAYSLATLLTRHPAPWDSQPRDMLRAVVKGSLAPQTMRRTAFALYTACAQRLRLHEALPATAAGALWNHVRMREGGPKA